MASAVKNRQGVGENLNEITRGSPCKVVWEVYENGASGKSGANLPWVWQIFKVDAKSGPLERGDYDENGESDENSESPDLLAIAEMASLVKNGQRVGEKLNNLWEGLWFWRKRHISCVLIHPTFSCRRPNRSTPVTKSWTREHLLKWQMLDLHMMLCGRSLLLWTEVKNTSRKWNPPYR